MNVSMQGRSVTGVVKNWNVITGPDGLHITFNEGNKKMKTQKIPTSACVNNDPEAEAKIRIEQKVAEGFQVVTESEEEADIISSAPKDSVESSLRLDAIKKNDWF